MKSALPFLFFALLAGSTFAQKQKKKPTYPDFKKLFQEEVELLSMEDGHQRSYHYATDRDFQTLKTLIAQALGPDWAEVPAPPEPKLDPKDPANPFQGLDLSRRPKTLGVARYLFEATEKPVTLNVKLGEFPAHGKKARLIITTWEAFNDPDGGR